MFALGEMGENMRYDGEFHDDAKSQAETILDYNFSEKNEITRF